MKASSISMIVSDIQVAYADNLGFQFLIVLIVGVVVGLIGWRLLTSMVDSF